MKPYGREKKITGGNNHGSNWKTDYHLHKKNKKLKNWWETIADCLTRASLKQKDKKDIKKILEEE